LFVSICQTDAVDAKLHEKPGDQTKSASPKKEEKGIVKPAVSLFIKGFDKPQA
jgi:hypothetical protein